MVFFEEMDQADEHPGIDYAAGADSFAKNKEASTDEQSSDSDGEEEEEEAARGHDSDDDSKEDASDDDGDPHHDGGKSQLRSTPSSSKQHAEPCTFDLRNLLAVNAHQIDATALYTVGKAQQHRNNKSLTIPPPCVDSSKKNNSSSKILAVNEDYLMGKAMDGCAQLVSALWQLPVERSDAGPMIQLPSYDESRIPRALPPPPPRQETKWEKFARERRLPLNTNKRSRKVWDEATGTWMYRHGYQKANDDSGKNWPIMEVKGNEDPYEDPWEKQRETKRARVEKNVEQRMRNRERAGDLPKGTTTRMQKSKERTREAGKAGSRADNSLPAGLPVDMRRSKTNVDMPLAGSKGPMKRGKESTMAALVATQRSTASLGKFDKVLEGEPARKKGAPVSKQKGKYQSPTDRKVMATEAERSLKVLRSVVEGGGAAKEKAIKKGRFAKGVTAYDYDYDDGLGASSFKKKKGRAGGGKAKKMTKKRIS